jgi:hypothetical protein
MPDEPDETKPARTPARTPVVHQGRINIQITSRVGSRDTGSRENVTPSIDARHFHLVDLDREPLDGEVWFERAYDRLMADPDRPRGITEASHWLRTEMEKAFHRRQIDKLWEAGYLENKLRKLGWKRTRR